MKNIFKIYKRDLKNIVTNWVALTVTLALIILPALYAWFNIKSSWDPYGNTAGIKVGVVNLDVGGDFREKKYDLGNEIIEKLKDNDKIGWTFVDEEEGRKGVENGEYYATLIIPSDFTEKLLSITTNEIQYPSLQYIVNEKTNAIAPKITDKGVNTVKDEVDTTVVKTVDGIIFKIMNQVGIEAEGLKPQARLLIDQIYKLNNDMPKIQELVDKAYEGTISVDELINKVNGLLPTVEETISDSKDVLTKSKEYLEKAGVGLEKLGPTIKEDLIIANNIVGGANELINSIDSIDLEQSKEITVAKLNKIKERIDGVNSSINSLTTVLESVNKLVNSNGIAKAIDSLKVISSDISKVSQLIGNTVEGINNGTAVDMSKIEEIKRIISSVNVTLTDIINNYDSKILPGIESGINELNKISSNGLYLLDEAENSMPDFKNILSLLDKGAIIGNEELGNLKLKLPELKDKLAEYTEKIRGLDDEAKIDEIIDLITNDWNEESEFLSSPVRIDEEKLFPIPNYGSGMSPFFSTLALWVGALILVSLFTVDTNKLNEDEELTAIEKYFGKYLTFSTIAILQGLVVTLGDIYLLKTYVVNPGLFVGYGMFISLVFMTIIYTLVSVFGNVGKAIGVILLVLQISASGGTFPVEVMPQFFQKIHPLLPFKYGIGAMREAVGGIVIEILKKDTMYLLGYFVIFMLIGVLLKKFVNNASKGFVQKLKESGLIGH